MTTRATTANGLSKQEAKYLTLIDERLEEIQAIHRDIVRKRSEGRKVRARIDRNLRQIQTVIDRVEATL